MKLLTSARTAAAAVAIFAIMPAFSPAQAQQNSTYNYGGYQQYYQAQQVQPQYSIYGRRQIQQGQYARPWYHQQQPAQPGNAPAGASASRRQAHQVKQSTLESDGAASSVRRADRTATASGNHSWMTSFDSALGRASEQGRPLVALFVHHGCPECDRMDQNLAHPGAMDTLASAVKVRVEFTANAAAVHRYGVTLTPTFLVLTPQGAEAYREVGALSVDRLRQIQPAIDSLVAAPRASTKQVTRSEAKTDALNKDESTSKTVAAL